MPRKAPRPTHDTSYYPPRDMVPEYYDVASSDRTDDEAGALRQVAVDVPRTAPGVLFFHQQRVQKVLERVLFIWGLRCGWVRTMRV